MYFYRFVSFARFAFPLFKYACCNCCFIQILRIYLKKPNSYLSSSVDVCNTRRMRVTWFNRLVSKRFSRRLFLHVLFFADYDAGFIFEPRRFVTVIVHSASCFRGVSSVRRARNRRWRQQPQSTHCIKCLIFIPPSSYITRPAPRKPPRPSWIAFTSFVLFSVLRSINYTDYRHGRK